MSEFPLCRSVVVFEPCACRREVSGARWSRFCSVPESWSNVLHLALFILLHFWYTKSHHFMDIRIGPQALERPLLFLIRSRTDLYASFRFVLTDFKAKSFRRRRLFHFLFSCRVNDRPDTNEHDRQYRWLLEVRDRRAQSTGKEAYTSFPDSQQVVWSNEC